MSTSRNLTKNSIGPIPAPRTRKPKSTKSTNSTNSTNATNSIITVQRQKPTIPTKPSPNHVKAKEKELAAERKAKRDAEREANISEEIARNAEEQASIAREEARQARQRAIESADMLPIPKPRKKKPEPPIRRTTNLSSLQLYETPHPYLESESEYETPHPYLESESLYETPHPYKKMPDYSEMNQEMPYYSELNPGMPDYSAMGNVNNQPIYSEIERPRSLNTRLSHTIVSNRKNSKPKTKKRTNKPNFFRRTLKCFGSRCKKPSTNSSNSFNSETNA